MKRLGVLVVLVAAALPGAPACAAPPATTAGEAVKASLEHDGKAIRIVFKDGQQLVVPMEDTEAVTFDEPEISEDHRSVAWTEELQVAASYPDAKTVYVYRNGKPARFLKQDGKTAAPDPCSSGGATMDWQFYASGRQLYVACGYPHGAPSEYRNLYDLDTGKLLGSVSVSDDTGEPPNDAPAWAKSGGH